LQADGSVRLGPLVLHGLLVPRWPASGRKVRLMVRPEAWRLLPASGSGLAGKVLRRAYLGRSVEYTIEVVWGELLVCCVGPHSFFQCGSPVSLGLGNHGVSVLSREADAVFAATALQPEIKRSA
jgi:iron(III) transport system ATP-binding protein